MAYRNPSKSSSHGKHLHDAHRVCWETKHAQRRHLATHWFTIGVTREPVGRIHCHSSTEDNATSFSKPDTVINVDYLNKPSFDPSANRTKTVAVATNTEATKSQHRNLPNVDQTDSTSDDVPRRPLF